MKTQKNYYFCFAVVWLLALFAVSSANAYDDEVKVVSAGKQIVQVDPSPVIDDGEPADVPDTRTQGSYYNEVGSDQATIIMKDSGIVQRSIYKNEIFKMLIFVLLSQFN